MLGPLAVVRAFGLGDADRNHLGGVVPLVNCRRHIEALVALQADEAAGKRRGEHLGDLGLADASLPFEEQWPAHPQCQKKHGPERAVGEIVRARKELDGGVDRGGKRARGCGLFRACTAGAFITGATGSPTWC